MSGHREPASNPFVPFLVGALVTAVVGVAAWQSPRPWTFAMDTGNGFLGQTLPAYRTWMSGRIPEWSDLLWGGFPLLGDCSNAALYPPHVIAYLASLGAPLRFFDVALALHCGLLAAGSAYLVRQLGCGTVAQVLAGVLSVLCPATHYSAIVFFPAFAAQAWWSWALAAAERLARPSTPALGGAMLLGWLALGAQVLAGMPEQATYCAVVTSGWLLTRNARLGLGARTARLALLGTGAVAVAAPQLLATLAYLPATTRAAHVAGELSQAVAVSLQHPEQLTLVGTGVLNGIPSFFGLATPLLALAAVAARRPRAAFLVVLAAIALALATGPATPLYGWLQRMPPFDHFRTPLKLQVLAELALTWAAALGADSMRVTRTGWVRVAIAALIVATLGERGLYVAQELPIFQRLATNSIIAPDVVEALGRTRAVLARRTGEPPLLVLDGTERYGGNRARSLGALVGLSSLRAYPVALLGRMHEALLNVQTYDPALATLLGVRYLLVDAKACQRDAKRFQWPVVDETPDFCLLQNPVKVARHALLHDAVAVTNEDEMVARVRAHPDGAVAIVAAADAMTTSGDGLILLRSYEAGHARLGVTTPSPTLLLVRDSWLPGWGVMVDGVAVTPYPAAGIYFAVPVPPGAHEIGLDYRAPGFRAGLGLLLGWAIGTAAWITVRRRRGHAPR